MKTSPNKVSLPGRKQVYRQSNRGVYSRDVIGLEREKGLGKPLLQQMMKSGRLVYSPPEISQITAYYRNEKSRFHDKMFSVWKQHVYSVSLSSKLQTLVRKTRKEIHASL